MRFKVKLVNGDLIKSLSVNALDENYLMKHLSYFYNKWTIVKLNEEIN